MPAEEETDPLEEATSEGEEEYLPPQAVFHEEVADTPNEKLFRISRVDLQAQADAYRSNTLKEEQMLEYVRHFQSQFRNVYPKRRDLVLAPRNECGMRKFICTTLRPTQLPYQDLYDYGQCAKFVADFIRYEPLELASQLPQHMPSPSATLGWQAGDCFDCAMVLCSLLLGVGYDAYVVSGYAPGAITRCDQSSTRVTKDDGPVAVAPVEAPPPSKYAVPPKLSLTSQFLKNKAEREAAAREKQNTGPPTLDAGEKEALAANEAEELDELKGRRVHAWVMVLPGKRLLEQLVFLEPSTGAIYNIDQSVREMRAAESGPRTPRPPLSSPPRLPRPAALGRNPPKPAPSHPVSPPLATALLRHRDCVERLQPVGEHAGAAARLEAHVRALRRRLVGVPHLRLRDGRRRRRQGWRR